MKKLIALVCILAFANVAQAKDLSKEKWLKGQEKRMEKAGKEFNAEKAEKRWAKFDVNADGKLDKEEKKAMKADMKKKGKKAKKGKKDKE
ncbi:hypothetical protein [Paraglaciecola sp.]|uniref:hypothetical protein n=1 Tax=Paraglaciecola sp. TaxID=1920173 RepID=UPI003EF9733A